MYISKLFFFIFSTSMCRGHGAYFLTIHSFLVFSAVCCKREKRTKKSFLSFWNCRNIQAGNNKSKEQYYIATEDRKTEGPYSFESLEAFYTDGKIRIDTLVCIAGSQEWVQFWTILEQEPKGKIQPCEGSKKQALERLMNEYDPIPKDPPPKELQKNTNPLEITIELIFQVVGIVCFVLSAVCLILLGSGLINYNKH